MTWPVWVLAICAAVALLCMLVGVIRAALAARVVNAHLQRLKNEPLIAGASNAQACVKRINDDVAQIELLLARAQIALRTIREGIEDLRVPEAVVAVRTAGAAIRLLFSGR